MMTMFLFALSLMKTSGRNSYFHLSTLQRLLLQSDPENELDIEPPATKLRNLSEAIRHLEDVQVFLDRRGYINEAIIIASAVDTVASLHCKNGRQSSLDEYLNSP